MAELLQHNSLSELHDGKNIFFCKTDYLDKDFKYISNIKQKVILITGNADEGITDTHVARAPPNIKKWFCQNVQTNSDLVEAIPLGLENIIECCRKGHGVSWRHAEEKHQTLSDIWSNPSTKEPSRLIYGNFNSSTAPECRVNLMNHAKSIDHITWNEPDLSYSKFIEEALDHEAVLCPSGNGVDTHRFYETLYLGRIPIIFKHWYQGGHFWFKKLYHKFPVVVVGEKDLYNQTIMEEKIQEAKSRECDPQCLDARYWKAKITSNI